MAWLERCVREGLDAVGEVVFPANDVGAPGWREVGAVEHGIAWMRELPPEPRRLLAALFVLVELAGPLLLTGSPRRLSRLPPERRLRLVERLRASKRYPLRVIGDSLKSVATIAWLSDRRALAWLGVFKACEHPEDPFALDERLGALR